MKNLIMDFFERIKEDPVVIIKEGSEMAGSATPYISGIINYFKHKKTKDTLLKHEERFYRMESELLKLKKGESDFVLEKILPFLIDQIYKEQQQEKVDIMLNGIDTIISEKMFDEDKILYYFDVLSELRNRDIKRFIDRYLPLELRVDDKLNLNLNEDEYDYIKYTDNKLLRLGLLKYQTKGSNIYNKNNYENFYDDKEYDLDRFEISAFGIKFYNFFKNNNKND